MASYEYPSAAGGGSGSNASVGPTGSLAPTSATEIGAVDVSGNLQPLQVNSSKALLVDITGGASPANVNLTQVGSAAIALGQTTTSASMPVTIASNQPALPISAASLPLPTGAATETTLASLNGKVTAVNTGAVTVSSSVLPTGAATAAKQPALGTAGTASSDVLTVQGITSMTPLLVNGSGSTQPISGTVTANAGTNLNTSLLALDTTVAALEVAQGSTTSGQKGALIQGAVTTAAPSYTTAQTAPLSLTTGGLLRVSAAVTTAANVNGSYTTATVSGTAASLSPPSNSVGFLLQTNDTNSFNLRWGIGTTVTASTGTQLEPGRSTGYVPAAATVSVISESGTNEYTIQWILSV